MEEIAAVYARSLFEVAQEQDKLDLVREQLGEFADALNASRELQTFLFSPYFSTPEKEDGLDRAVTGADPTIVNFLKLLIENHRTPVIFRVRRIYDELWEEENQLLPVRVSVPAPMRGAETAALPREVTLKLFAVAFSPGRAPAGQTLRPTIAITRPDGTTSTQVGSRFCVSRRCGVAPTRLR